MTKRGIVIVFGPVMDPKCVYGVAVIEVDSEEKARELVTGDPVTKAGLGRYEFFPMRVGTVRS